MMRKKPIACSYTLSLKPLKDLISSREVNGFVSLNFKILSIVFLLKPDIYFKILALAVFKLTPISFTILPTVKDKASLSSFWLTSCWYSPTPML